MGTPPPFATPCSSRVPEPLAGPPGVPSEHRERSPSAGFPPAHGDAIADALVAGVQRFEHGEPS